MQRTLELVNADAPMHAQQSLDKLDEIIAQVRACKTCADLEALKDTLALNAHYVGLIHTYNSADMCSCQV